MTISIGLYGGGRMRLDEDGTVDVSSVTPVVLAFGLSHVTRFGGMAGSYGVAEHSVRMYDWAKGDGQDKAVLRAILLHDAPECLGEGDHQRFVKRRFFGDGPAKYSDLICRALWSRFIPSDRPIGAWPWSAVHQTLKQYDEWMGSVEARAFGFPYESLPEWLTVPSCAIPPPWPRSDTSDWEYAFLARWEDSQ